jgi:hypothetical protein
MIIRFSDGSDVEIEINGPDPAKSTATGYGTT